MTGAARTAAILALAAAGGLAARAVADGVAPGSAWPGDVPTASPRGAPRRPADARGPAPLDAGDRVHASEPGLLEATSSLPPSDLLERFRERLAASPPALDGTGPTLAAWLASPLVLRDSRTLALAGRMDPDGSLLLLVAIHPPGAPDTWYSLVRERPAWIDAGGELNPATAFPRTGLADGIRWEIRGTPAADADETVDLGEGEFACFWRPRQHLRAMHPPR